MAAGKNSSNKGNEEEADVEVKGAGGSTRCEGLVKKDKSVAHRFSSLTTDLSD